MQEVVGSLDHSIFWLFGFVTTKMFHFLFANFGLSAIFVGIFGVCVSSIIFTVVVIPETREARHDADKAVLGSTNDGFVSTSL